MRGKSRGRVAIREAVWEREIEPCIKYLDQTLVSKKNFKNFKAFKNSCDRTIVRKKNEAIFGNSNIKREKH